MTGISHQTIKLSRGRHSSPQDGACVMELASMLAGQPFSDHPSSVCPLIGSLLRSYNDSIDDRRRQDLYRYAAAVVGTNGSAEAREARVALLSRWVLRRRAERLPRRLLPERLRTAGLGRLPRSTSLGSLAVRVVGRPTDDTHAQVLELLDELIAVSDGSRPRVPSASGDSRSREGRVRTPSTSRAATLV
jgi:hypothetical protein